MTSEDEDYSAYRCMKQRMNRKMDDMKGDMLREIREELEEHDNHVQDAKGVALDLVHPDTLDKLKEVILEKPENEEVCSWRLLFSIVSKIFTSIILKLVDIGTDLGAAYLHFKRSDLNYGFLTLFFVYLPGFVLSCGFVIWGLFYKTSGDSPRRKPITCQRLGKYLGVLFLFPILYPIIQIILGALLVGLLIRRKDHVATQFMGHDLKQFKSLEGFLESGPSFCLQTYIIMVGHERGTNLDWNNIREDDIERLFLLCLSILFSFISIVKTAVSVNVGDPDERRGEQQYPANSPHFYITLVLFSAVCILFRMVGISFFTAYIRQWTLLIILLGFLVNFIVLLCVRAGPSLAIVLGAISLFVPNGYLLYNFAGTIELNLDRKRSRSLFLATCLLLNAIWLSGVGGVAVYTGTSGLPLHHLIRDEATHQRFVIGMNISLGCLAMLSSVLGLLHWFYSVEKIFLPPCEELELQQSCLDS